MANTYLSRTISTATNEYKGTLSWWQKGMSTDSTQYILACESGNERLLWYGTSGRFQGGLRASSTPPDIDFTLSGTPRFRDPNAWYHCVLAWDSTQSSASDRIKYYVNNIQYTISGSGTGGVNDVPQNHVMPMNKSGLPFRIGSTIGGGSYYEGVISHMHFVDGTQYTPSTFGETDSTTGEWKIKEDPSGITYGNNGFWWLKDTNAATDSSPNSNTPSIGGAGLTKTEDCPSNVFATLNPLDQAHISTKPTIAYGNTQWTASGNSTSNCSIRGTIGASSGKYYFEVKLLEATNQLIGVDCPDVAGAWYDNTGYMGNHSGFYAILINSTDTIRSVVAGSGGGTDLGTVTNNDIIGCAFDFDNGKFYFSKNGSWLNSGDPTSGSTGTGSFGNLASGLYVPAITNYSYGTASSTAFNFGNGYFGTTAVSSAGTNASGNGIFEYDVPTGYTALSTKGLNL